MKSATEQHTATWAHRENGNQKNTSAVQIDGFKNQSNLLKFGGFGGGWFFKIWHCSRKNWYYSKKIGAIHPKFDEKIGFGQVRFFSTRQIFKHCLGLSREAARGPWLRIG
jgi:hypothetical protein